MFARFKAFKSTLLWENTASSGSPSPATGTNTGTGNQVDITISCFRQFYNAVGYNASATNGNKPAVTGYLEHPIHLRFLVGDGNPDPVTQQCYANVGANRTVFLPEFSTAYPCVTSVEVPSTFLKRRSSSLVEGSATISLVPHTKTLQSPSTWTVLLWASMKAGTTSLQYDSGINLLLYAPRVNYIRSTSPTFASFISMFNDAGITAGKSPLGFLNQWLYEDGYMALNDITEGNNLGCGTQGFKLLLDGILVVTGLGTPNFEKLKVLVLVLAL
ncbi:hypothetical protein PAXINDRAFT_13845 [Paxillus involutus ATCC 200175]|uniref:Peptidase S53 domain-containing protein n=1 Tax=Paxillus involutus ATCC 200175 TaxID=664439 RepID=A0A0C9TSH1_PAXIN|nr:hypothetical protein PAXINDRAFT_13845 [Paxillus involutus ATCC 200175]